MSRNISCSPIREIFHILLIQTLEYYIFRINYWNMQQYRWISKHAEWEIRQKRVYTIYICLHEVSEQTKLFYGDRNQSCDCQWQEEENSQGLCWQQEGNSYSDEKVLHLDRDVSYMGIRIRQNSSKCNS